MNGGAVRDDKSPEKDVILDRQSTRSATNAFEVCIVIDERFEE